jgi:hypothetical protein
MECRVKTIPETELSLGLSRRQIYRLLDRGELQRAGSRSSSQRGRPVTLVSVSSIVNYIKIH